MSSRTRRNIQQALANAAAPAPSGPQHVPGTVAVGFLYAAEVASGFANSLAAMLWAQGQRTDRRVVVEVLAEASGVNVSSGRNAVTRRFLDETRAEWLLMLDADMTFAPDLPDALLSTADPDPSSENFSPIIGALCFGVDNGKLFPTMYDFRRVDDRLETVRYETYPEDAMFQVGATGAACLLIHRSVAEAIRGHGFNAVYPWFQETELSGERCGEDITFCLRAGSLGFPVFVNTAVPIGHQKTQVLTVDLYRAQRAASAPKTKD